MSDQGKWTGEAAQRALEKEPEKLTRELREKQKELGLENMIPTRNQDVLQQLTDIDAERNNIIEAMQKAKEERVKRTAQERKAKEKTFSEKLKLALAQQERKARHAYESRRVVFDGFSQYEGTVRMLPFRVLVKVEKGRPVGDGSIVLPEDYGGDMPLLRVLCVGDGVDEVEVGDVVLTDKYAGVEIVDGGNIYRILYGVDVLCRVED